MGKSYNTDRRDKFKNKNPKRNNRNSSGKDKKPRWEDDIESW